MEQLPPKMETTITVDMPPEQRKVYSAALMQRRLHVMDLLRERGLSASRIQVLALITQLRQICCHPALVMAIMRASGKLDVLMDILPQMLHDGHRADFLAVYGHVSLDPPARTRRAWLILDSDTPARSARRCAFEGREGRILNLAQGGRHGAYLTGADTVIHYDPWWNPPPGIRPPTALPLGTQVIQVLKLVMHDSIEEQVVTMGRHSDGCLIC